MLRQLHLWVKKDGKDVDLGTVWCDDVPRKDDLLSHGTVHGHTWKVITVYRQLIQQGSRSWMNWERGEYTRPIWVDVFVEPVDGPFEP